LPRLVTMLIHELDDKSREEALTALPHWSYEADKKSASESGEPFIEMRDREIIAMIAYLQRLGTDIKIKETNELLSENK